MKIMNQAVIKNAIRDLLDTVDQYPKDGSIGIGGDVYTTTVVSVQTMRKILKLAKIGIEFAALSKSVEFEES